jgi:hypothetical protein
MVPCSQARILAELSEAWENRVPMVQAGVLRTLHMLIQTCEDRELEDVKGGQFDKVPTTGQVATRYECARCLADLAEAVELRQDIAEHCLPDLRLMMTSPLAGVPEQAMRCMLNLAAPAGQVAVTTKSAKVRRCARLAGCFSHGPARA